MKKVCIALVLGGMLSCTTTAQNGSQVAAEEPTKETAQEKRQENSSDGTDYIVAEDDGPAIVIPYRPGEHPVDEQKVYDVVEQMPSFPGGPEALMEFISRTIVYPKSALKQKIQGRVIVTFVVEADGSLSNAKVIKSVDSELDKEALRVVRKMPRWIPGQQNGRKVKVKYVIPVTFRLNKQPVKPVDRSKVIGSKYSVSIK